MGDTVIDFTEVQINLLPFLHVVTPSWKATGLVKQDLVKRAGCLRSPPYPPKDSTASRRICYTILPGTDMRLEGQSFPGSTFKAL